MLRLRDYLTLTKFWIAGLSTLSAGTGYLVWARAVRAGLFTASLGVLLLAMGACALNEWQERDLDARMKRTRNRPLPAGILSPRAGLMIALGHLAGGAGVLLMLHPTAALLGLSAVAWYNGLYTALKRVTAFAVVPGSVIGAIPPVIGWSAAGGPWSDPQILSLAFFFFIWQVPHFWLLLFLHGGDYGDAGLPTLTAVFNHRQLARLTSVWMVAAAGTSLLLPLFGVVTNPFIRLVLAGAGVWLGLVALRLSRGSADLTTFRRAFGWINLFALLVMVLLVGDALLAGGEPASFTRFRRETRETAAEAGIPDSFGCRGQERSGERGAVLYRTATSLRASTPAAGAVSLVARKGHASQQKFW